MWDKQSEIANKPSEIINQKKMDALAAKYLHAKRLASLSRLNVLVDYLTIGITVLYFPVRYLAKGTPNGSFVEHTWEFLAAILLAFTIFKIVYRWQERAEKHSKLIGENISLASQADYFLTNANNVTQENTHLFLLLADNVEKTDREILGTLKNEERKYAYREALKEIYPSSVEAKCPVCKQSPWQYKPGSCQLCGNTPASE